MTADRRQRTKIALVNRFTSRLMNTGYRLMLAHRSPGPTSIFQSMFPFYGKETYFSLFGRQGFYESQIIVPHTHFAEFTANLREAAAESKAVICFSALKLFAGVNDLTRFDGTGVSLAIHLPRSATSLRFLEIADQITVAMGGRPNIIKDSRLPRAIFEATYPDCDRFRSILRRWDRDRIFQSELANRLGL